MPTPRDLLSRISRRTILGAGIAVIGILVVATVIALAVLRKDALDAAEWHLKNLATLLADQSWHSVYSVELVSKTTADELKDRFRGRLPLTDQELSERLGERIRALPNARLLAFVDPSGKAVLHDARVASAGADFSDREHFRVHLERRINGLYVGRPIVGRLHKEWLDVFSWRVEDAQGTFRGVIAVSVTPSYFETLFSAIDLGEGGQVFLVRDDGVLLASHPALERVYGLPLADGLRFPTGRYGSRSGVQRRADLADGEPRIVAYRRLEGYPLAVAVSATERFFLASWRRDAWRIGLGAAGAAAFIAGALFFLLRQVRVSAGLQHDLQEAGERLHGIIDSAMDAIITVDDSQRVVLFNAAAEKIFRCPAAEAIGGPLERFIPERFRAAHRAHIENFSRTGATTRMMGARLSLYGLRADGEEFPLDASISQVADDNKRFYTVILRDITERKKAEEALHQAFHERRVASERFHGIIQSAMDAVIATDSAQRIVLFNEAAETIFRCRAQEAIGGPLERFIPERFRAAHRGDIQAFGATRVTTRMMGPRLALFGLRADGEEFPIDASISQVMVEGEKFFTVILRDISERKRAEAEIREERDTAQRYLDIAGVVLLALDSEGKVTLINRKGCELLGYGEDEIVGQSWFDRFLPERERENTRNVYRRIMAGEIRLTEFHENPVLTRGGAERLMAWHNRALTDETGRVSGTLSSGEDVTERKRTEQALERSYTELRELSTAMNEVREAERTRIARELHDELAQWLTALKMDVSWVASRLPREHPQLIDKTEKMKQVVDTTVASVRRIAADLRPVMLDDLGLVPAVEGLLHELSERSDIMVALDADAEALDYGEPLATSVYRMVQEALTNVARHAAARETRVSMGLEGEDLVVRVRDDGRGYDAEAAARRKSYGIVGIRERAHSLGGSARVLRLERGTLVEITIPAARYRKRGREA